MTEQGWGSRVEELKRNLRFYSQWTQTRRDNGDTANVAVGELDIEATRQELLGLGIDTYRTQILDTASD